MSKACDWPRLALHAVVADEWRPWFTVKGIEKTQHCFIVYVASIYEEWYLGAGSVS